MTGTDASTDDQLLRRAALGVLVPGFVGTTLPDWLGELLEEGMAGVWLFGHNVQDDEQVRALSAQVHARRPEALVAADEEGGTVTRLHHRDGSPWPGAWALGVADDVALTREVMAGLGRQLREVGIDVTAAPDADVNTEPANPVIGVRSFGPDAERVAGHVAAAVEGLDEAGVLACAKHFPGHGSTRVDSHLDLPVLDVDDEVLRARELVPFAAAVHAGVPMVMTGHLVVPGHGDLPATLNPSVLRVLREDLGFEGVICTDALDMAAVAQGWGRAGAAVLALAAGADLLCIGNPVHPGDYDARQDTLALADAVVGAVRRGDLSRERLLEAAGRVARLGRQQAQRRGAPSEQTSDAAAARAGRAAAARAVRVVGQTPVLRGPDVAALGGGANIASGARQEVLTRVLARELGGRVVEPSRAVADTTDRGGLVLVSDDHTDLGDDAGAEIARALLARCDVLVHTGIRELPDGDAPACVVRTHGGGAASAAAAADVLRGAR
ncbi:glycoside hydrolase family 3 N-terminal domain-containing protein [uncultured Serinicoccus sp.]|uniref:glycoside hydrolase family 3 N-terminal domain-containing protein n=1 Tax=uncultured Serinicoccus sp. TaxID=735514 RepID=UPI002620C6D7|nr:glycoside hydrolase family 3 N-terminal domain-containing protein [uncultured Serinicoccus sp.]